MSFANYRAGVTGIAAAELEGEDVQGRIAQLARAARMPFADVRHAVTEAQED